jgi:RNA polymerase sigma-70 factor (ECF subfamily)
MARAQAGDRRAYEQLLTEAAALVTRFVRRRVPQPDWCEEIVQDTLLAIHRDRRTYDPARPFGPWMYAIARHRLLDHVEQQRRHGRAEPLTEADLDRAALEPPPRTGLTRLLDRVLGQLSNAQREVIQMMKLEGRSVAETARATGMTESTVKVTAHRGYKKLRQLIGDGE